MLAVLLLRAAVAAPVSAPLSPQRASPEQAHTISPSLQQHILERYWYHFMENVPNPSSLHTLKEMIAVVKKTMSDTISDVDRDIATSKQIAHVTSPSRTH